MSYIEARSGELVLTVIDHGDGTGTRTTYDAAGNVTGTEQVEMPLPAPPTVDEARTLLDTIDAEQRLTAIADRVTPEQARTLAPLLPPWTVGEAVEVGALRTHEHVVYEVIQAHTTQADWLPPTVPALWKVWRNPDADVPADWVQPTGSTDAYSIGEKVTFEGAVYESLIDGNTWSPSAYPAGWRKL